MNARGVVFMAHVRQTAQRRLQRTTHARFKSQRTAIAQALSEAKEEKKKAEELVAKYEPAAKVAVDAFAALMGQACGGRKPPSSDQFAQQVKGQRELNPVTRDLLTRVPVTPGR